MFRTTTLLLKNAKAVYRNFLIRKPYLSQAIQVSLLMGTGDVLAQTAVEKKLIKDIDVSRTLKYASLGFFFIGPSLRVWYGKLDKITKNQTQLWKIATIKVALDQIIFAPIFLAIVTVLISASQGMDLDKIIQRLKSDYGSVLKTNYYIWPLAQVLNFSIIPLHYQVLFAQVVALIWNTYLSVKFN